MLRFLRRSRLVPLFLLLAMPGVGGTLVQAGHPCAEKAPWTASAPAAGGHQHDAGGAGAPEAPGQKGHACECVGACTVSGAVVRPATMPTVVVALVAFRPPALPEHRAAAALPRPDRLLPPANAPPLS